MAVTNATTAVTATSVLSAVTPLRLATAVFIAVIAYYVARSIYRLYFCPLAKFPGPRLAALTGLYEMYYDIILDGKYTFKIMDLHRQYGPIIRIAPYQIHIHDTEFYSELYSRTGKWNKTHGFCNAFGNPLSGFGTEDHDIHRVRKAALSPFFSKRNVVLLAPVFQEKIEKFCRRLQGIRASSEVVELHCAYDCLATDVVTEYAMARSYNYLDVPDFLPDWHYTLVYMTRMLHVTKHIPWAAPLMASLPDRLVKSLNPGLGYMVDFQRDLAGQITKLFQTKDDEVKTKGRPTIMYELLHSDLPPQEKTFIRLMHEGQSIVGGGGDTIANVLATTSYYVLTDSGRLAKLKAELTAAMPDPNTPPNLAQLEKLPYLTGVVQEGLRLSYGVSQRLMRIAPDRYITYRQWAIPPGTAIGMTGVQIHHDESVFPNSHSFVPERWISDNGTANNATTPDGRRLDKYLCSFSRGTRQCLGINLAYAELYMTLAAVFRRFELALYETTAEDVVLQHDWFLPHPKKGTKGVRVRVVG